MKSNDDCKVIITIKALAAWLQVSPPTISMYMKLEDDPLTGDLIGGRWHFHRDLVNDWFYRRCRKRWNGKIDPMDMEKDGLSS